MTDDAHYGALVKKIKAWGTELGFAQVGISDIDLRDQEAALQRWLDNNYHGEMEYMARHGMMRARPDELLPETLRVISVRLDYLPPEALIVSTMKKPENGYISRYATGRDYHKMMRNRLKKLAQKIETEVESLGARPFVDSAPVLERPLAAKAGLGWVGKHSLLINQEAGSFFFLGELLVNIPLPVDTPVEEKCGSCVACLKICPTQAIVEPYVVDGRRCISYLTIELDGAIPEEFRPLIGNRIYGCDDCQLICPWNKFAQASAEDDFKPRKDLHTPELLSLFAWTEAEFLKKTEGSPIRRIGHHRWLRNIAIALGNAPYQPGIVEALEAKLAEADEMVAEHLHWAIEQQRRRGEKQPDRKILRLMKTVEKGMPAHS